MNFENKQFRMGRFCERVSIYGCEFNEIKEWISFINSISREFDIQLNEKILLASLKLSYGFDEEMIIKVGRKNYYLVGNVSRIITDYIDGYTTGILFIENDKVELLKRDEIINKILQKMFN
jgi:hypothetical protein